MRIYILTDLQEDTFDGFDPHELRNNYLNSSSVVFSTPEKAFEAAERDAQELHRDFQSDFDPEEEYEYIHDFDPLEWKENTYENYLGSYRVWDAFQEQVSCHYRVTEAVVEGTE